MRIMDPLTDLECSAKKAWRVFKASEVPSPSDATVSKVRTRDMRMETVSDAVLMATMSCVSSYQTRQIE